MTKRFWIKDEFIDNYASKLSLKAQMVYICLCRHANSKGITNIGKNRIAEKLGISRNTVRTALQELERGQFLTPYSWKMGQNGIRGGRRIDPLMGQSEAPKELGIIFKEEFLKNFSPNSSFDTQQALIKLRKQLAEKFNWSFNK